MTTSALAALMRADTGLPAKVSQIAEVRELELAPFCASRIVTMNVSSDMVERATGMKYPLVHIYCERFTNLMTEKFRRFSGKAHMVLEIRISQDRIEDLDERLQAYVDAVTEVLDENKGSWDSSICYLGGYDVAFGPVKHGGKNFLQTAKVALLLNVSVK
jgi:hypothetical protein